MKTYRQSKYLGIIIIVLLAVVGGYFFLRGSYQTPTSSSVQTQAPTVTPEETAKPPETSAITEINVVGTEYNFSPADISVKAGERVKITFSNKGRAPHNLILEGLDIATKTIGGGQTDVIEFTAPSLGRYAFFCSVPGHRASGMEGSLKVQ